MRIFRHYNSLPKDVQQAVIAIGNFDGVHLGHKLLINEAERIARKQNLPLAVLTFEPHPNNVFKPKSQPFRLTPFRAKVY